MLEATEFFNPGSLGLGNGAGSCASAGPAGACCLPLWEVQALGLGKQGMGATCSRLPSLQSPTPPSDLS